MIKIQISREGKIEKIHTEREIVRRKMKKAGDRKKWRSIQHRAS